MRVNLAVITLHDNAAKEMAENENEATTQKYIKICSKIVNILNSEEPIKEENDPRIIELSTINQCFFSNGKHI